jgi:hypothetical protein
MSEAPADLEQAIALFQKFQGRAPRGDELCQVGGLVKPQTALEVGQLISIGYKALGDGKDYYHEFSAPKARVFVSADGRQIYFVGGNYRFSERGFLK